MLVAVLVLQIVIILLLIELRLAYVSRSNEAMDRLERAYQQALEAELKRTRDRESSCA